MLHASAADIRAMKPAALDEFFASTDLLAPLVGTLKCGVDGGLLMELIADQQSGDAQALRPFFMASATNAHVVLLAEKLYDVLQLEAMQKRGEHELQQELLRAELSAVECSEYKWLLSLALACGDSKAAADKRAVAWDEALEAMGG